MSRQLKHQSHDVSDMLIVVLLVLFVTAPQVAAQQPVTQRAVLNAWRTRQARIQSASFNWLEKRLETVGGDNVAVSLDKTLLLSGHKVRYGFGGLRPTDDGKSVSQTFDSVFDGAVSKSLHSSNESRKFPAGFVSKNNPANVMHTLPIRWWYRPMDAEMAGFDAQNLTALNETTTIDGQRCYVLASEIKGNRRMLFAVCPEEDQAIRRCTVENNGQATRQYDIQYTKDKRHGWVPTGWTISLLGGNSRVSDGYQASVTSYQVNPTLGDSHFQLQFPMGTMVADKSSGELVDYMIKPAGEKRVIQRQEYSASYDELAATPSGSAFSGRKVMLTAFIVVVITAVAFALAWRSWRYEQSKIPS